MEKSKIAFTFLFAFVFISINVVAQELWSLEKCINYAFEHNIQIKQSVLDVESSGEDLLQSKLSLLPTLNASASHNTGWGRSLDMATYRYTNKTTRQMYFSLNSDITLFNGLQQVNTIRKRQFDYLAKKYNSDKIKNDMSLNIAAAYLQILFNTELVNNAKRQVEITRQQIIRTKKQVEAGVLAKGNLLDIEAQGANEEVNLVNAKNRLTLSYLDLMQLLDLKSDIQFDIEKPQLDINAKPQLLPVNTIYNTAIGIMPEIKSAEYSLKSAEQSLAIARGQRSPRLTLNGSYGNNYSDQIKKSYDPTSPDFNMEKPFWDQIADNRNITLAFRLYIPIFNGFQVSNYINKSKIYKETANLNLELEKNNLRKRIEQAYTDAIAAYKTYQARKKSVESLRESFKYAQEKLNVGMLNSTDYNVAKIQLSNAESDLASAKFDYIFKTKILDFYLGKEITLKDISK
jgi:outer membrane protein